MKKNFHSYFLIPALVSLIVLGLLFGSQKLPSIYGQVLSNSTSTVCNADGTCTTTICINNEPCHTIRSNSTMSMRQDNSTDNENKSNPFDTTSTGNYLDCPLGR